MIPRRIIYSWGFTVLLIITLFFIGIQVASGDDGCGTITLYNNTDQTVMVIVNGFIGYEIYSFMGAELEPGEEFKSTNCYKYNWYDVVWLVPGEDKQTIPFYLKDDITLKVIPEI